MKVTTIIISCLLMVFLVGCNTAIDTPEEQPQDAPIESQATLSISDQTVERDIVVIGNAYFDKPGFILVFRGDELLGQSEIYLEGTYDSVGVQISNYQAGDSLEAIVYYDNGNNQFSMQDDTRTDVSSAFNVQ